MNQYGNDYQVILKHNWLIEHPDQHDTAINSPIKFMTGLVLSYFLGKTLLNALEHVAHVGDMQWVCCVTAANKSLKKEF